MIYLISVLFGAFFGSFLNVLIDRLPRGESFTFKRSYCESCKKSLLWYELIPVLSFAIQQGKCRECKAKIPFRIFFVEVLTGLLFGVVTYTLFPFGDYIQYILALAILCCLIVIFFVDLESGIIPDQILFALGIVALINIYINADLTLQNALISGMSALLVFLILFIGTKGRGIGFGDVKFALIIGLLLGFPGTLISIYFAFLTGAGISLILILIGKKRFKKDSIAFGPFLVLGIAFFYLYGDAISAYLQYFGL